MERVETRKESRGGESREEERVEREVRSAWWLARDVDSSSQSNRWMRGCRVACDRQNIIIVDLIFEGEKY